MNKLYGTQVEAVHFRGEALDAVELATGRIDAVIGASSPCCRTAEQLGADRREQDVSPPKLPRSPCSSSRVGEAALQDPQLDRPLGPAGLRAISSSGSETVICGRTRHGWGVHADFRRRGKSFHTEEFERRFHDDGRTAVDSCGARVASIRSARSEVGLGAPRARSGASPNLARSRSGSKPAELAVRRARRHVGEQRAHRSTAGGGRR